MLRPVPVRTPSPAPDPAVVLGDLKAFLGQCGEGELLLVRSWLIAELARVATPGLRVLRTPSAYLPGSWHGSFVELAGTLRRDLHQLPQAELLVLHGWVRNRLSYIGD